ncbi:MAG: helix-turn-helix transcriptional regulator [Verrucomicrobia bacterium]|nr:helix-turn-helix transcriptional regulator [Verrucomicrobiota bacterium]
MKKKAKNARKAKKAEKTISAKNARCGRLLKGFRSRNEWSQKTPAGDVGVATRTWSRWEQGTRFPETDRLQKIATYLRVPVCRICCDEAWQCPRQMQQPGQ